MIYLWSVLWCWFFVARDHKTELVALAVMVVAGYWGFSVDELGVRS